MDQGAKERFEEIVRKDAAALTEAEIAFLRARESYLTPEQRSRFATVLPAPQNASQDEGDEDNEDSEDEDAGKPLEEHSDKELKKVAKSVGLNPKDFEEREQLIEAIREKQSSDSEE